MNKIFKKPSLAVALGLQVKLRVLYREVLTGSVSILSEVARTVFMCDWLWQDFGKTSCHSLHQKEEFSCC